MPLKCKFQRPFSPETQVGQLSRETEALSVLLSQNSML